MDGPTTEDKPGRQRLPIAATGNSSAARILDDWYVVCTSEQLGKSKPLATMLYGLPIVVFRTAAGEVGALLDRCPHRNVPLSDGTVDGELLRCGYHGWAFDIAGACKQIPTLCGEPGGKARTVQRFAAREQDGLIWVYATPDLRNRPLCKNAVCGTSRAFSATA